MARKSITKTDTLEMLTVRRLLALREDVERLPPDDILRKQLVALAADYGVKIT